MYRLFTKKYILLVLYSLVCIINLVAQVIVLDIPDTICADKPLPIINNSTDANSHHWSFCNKPPITTTPSATNTSNFNGQLNTSVMSTPVLDGTNYYLFITNYSNNSLTKAKYGSSFLNTPTITNLGNFSNQLPSNIEGIQIKKDNNQWIGFLVGSNSLIRLDFGNSLDNTPTLTDLGNIGSLAWPHELYIFKHNGNWYGFAANRSTSSVTRLNFGSSLLNTPSGNTITNIGLSGGASGLELEQDATGNFYLFVTSLQGVISRIELGGNIMNTSPTYSTINDATLSGILRGLIILKDCNNYVGYACTESQKLVKIDFTGGINGTMTFTSLGNMSGTIKKANDISNAIIEGDNAYAFVTNTNNTITRLMFPFCTGGTNQFPPSSKTVPDSVSYPDKGWNNIYYTINFDDGNQKDTCFGVYSKICCKNSAKIKGTFFICQGDSTPIFIESDTTSSEITWFIDNIEATQYKNKDTIWVNNEGKYKAEVKVGDCTLQDSATVSYYKYQLNLAKNTTLCRDDSISIYLEYNSKPSEITWYLNSTPLSQHKNRDTIWADTIGVYSVDAKFGSCTISRSITLNYNYNQFALLGDTTICKGDSTPFYLQYDSIPDEIDWSLDGSPIVASKNKDTLWAKVNGIYKATARYENCYPSRALTLNYFNLSMNIIGDTIVCTGDSVLLSADKDYTSYSWSDGSTQKTIYAHQANTYILQVKSQEGCTLTDSVQIIEVVGSTINIQPDTLVCYLDFPFQYTIDDSCAICSYLWSNNTSGKTITVTDSGKYILKVSSVCKTLYDTLHIVKYDCSECFIHIPNAFTPDGHFPNDSFAITYDCRIIDWEMKIFDRWGELLRTINNPDEGWDGYYKGEKAPEGVYMYLINFFGGGKRINKAGTFLLLNLN